MSLALVRICQIKGIPEDDAAQMIGAACAEAVAQMIGPVRVAEWLRDIADITEAECLNGH